MHFTACLGGAAARVLRWLVERAPVPMNARDLDTGLRLTARSRRRWLSQSHFWYFDGLFARVLIGAVVLFTVLATITFLRPKAPKS